MSSSVRPFAPRTASRQTRILAAASGVVAAASITVTLAVGSGGSEGSSRPSTAPATAIPDRATLYQREAEVSDVRGTTAGERAAERFHHFR
jgi:hypothetical protein